MKAYHLLIVLTGFLMYGCGSQENNQSKISAYPESKKVDTVDTYFGVDVSDPYRWLEDDLSAETTDWVKSQNKVTFSYLDKIPYREKLKTRLSELYNYERVSAPVKQGDYIYVLKNDGLQNQSVWYRKKGEEGEMEVFLDPNTFSEDGTISLAGTSFTKDASMMAYSISEGGSDWRKVIVIDTETKEMIGDTLIDVKFSGVSWKGNEGFYYSSYDKPKGSELSAKTQYHKLYYHKMGTSQSQDQLVFGGEKQPNRYVGGGATRDGRFLLISASQTTAGNKLYVIDLNDPKQEMKLVDDDYNSRTNYVDHEGDRLIFQTNIDAPNYRLVSVDAKAPGKENWKDLIPETENVLSTNTGGGKIFATYLIDAKTQVKQFDLNGKLEREIELPGIGTAGGFGARKEDTSLYYSFTSFTSPTSIYKYDIAAGTSELYERPDVDFNPDDYVTEQIFYTSKDGTKVPMFIVYKKGIEKNGKNPTLLYSYGGFNISMRPGFSTDRILWLENGGIYAQPSIRGGGEYGKKWHIAGTKMQKQNVFDDFIAAGEYLIEKGYTSSDYLAIRGGSNGGLLVGATMTQRPDLAKVAFPAVGVMDMLRYHKFTAGAGWAYDYGTSDDSKEMFEYLRKYSPVHALKPNTAYPATMVTTADHDDRVVPAHSFKFAATLQENHVGDNPVLIRIETNAGHGAGTPITKRIEQGADLYSFAWYNMGVLPPIAKKEL